MARTRIVLTLLVVGVLLSAAAAGAAVPSRGRLEPTPPNRLPAHHHPSHPKPAPPGAPSSGLPNTGINARVEIAVAMLMLGCGALAKAYAVSRPGTRSRRR